MRLKRAKIKKGLWNRERRKQGGLWERDERKEGKRGKKREEKIRERERERKKKREKELAHQGLCLRKKTDRGKREGLPRPKRDEKEG